MSKAFNRETKEYDYDSDEWCVGCCWELDTGGCRWAYTVDECKEAMRRLTEKIIVDGEESK